MCVGPQTGAELGYLIFGVTTKGVMTMKKSRGGRMTAAKRRAAKSSGGRGRIKSRKAGRKIMKS
jgi:hypothetical protein